MGCVSSKQHQKVCQKCQEPYSQPASRKIHSPIRITTWGRRKPDSINSKELEKTRHRQDDEQKQKKSKMNEVIMDFPMAMAVVEAKNWSEMIEKKIPKILSKATELDCTPPAPVETINTWELMEGLEDPLRSFSFHVSPNPHVGEEISRNDLNSTIISDQLDREEISSFRKALEELHPANPFHLNPLSSVCNVSEESRITNIFGVAGKVDRVVLYFTSLRGVRKTYKDCCYVRITLRELGFLVDERDVSMHSGFKGELKELLRGEEGGLNMGFGLPRVFVGKKDIGGAEEIRQLHEEGGLEKALEGCERSGSGIWRRVCQGCGDIGFVPCETCCGSCKVFYEHDEEFYYQEEEEEEEDESEYGFKRCPDCNENGLIRCPICCDY